MDLWPCWKYCCFLCCSILCMLAMQFFVLWWCGKNYNIEHLCGNAKNYQHVNDSWQFFDLNFMSCSNGDCLLGMFFQHSICQQNFQLRIELIGTICWISHCCLSFIVLHLLNHCTGCCSFQHHGSVMMHHPDWYVTKCTPSIKSLCKSETSGHDL